MTPVIVTHCTPARLGVANSTILDPKCDILSIPDGVLGAGAAMRRGEFIAFVGSTRRNGGASACSWLYQTQSGEHTEHRAPEENHERRRVSRRSQAGVLGDVCFWR